MTSTIRPRRRPRTAEAFSAVDRELGATLDGLDHASRYADWLAELVGPDRVATIAEIGAGTGTITTRLLSRADRVIAVEPSTDLFKQLSERFEDEPRVECIHGDHRSLGGQVDAIVMSNVLEHIEDDTAALRELRECLRPGGTLAVLSPAFELLYSDFDHRIGHYRRYRRSELEGRFSDAGYTIDEGRYVNGPGAIAWFVYARVLGRAPAADTRALRAWDRVAIPVIGWIERRVRPPFGQSVLVVGRREG